MSGLPAELKKKSDSFLTKWQVFERQRDFDGFVEFAVAVSSLTEFLTARGLSGLNQSAHTLEQKVLSLFDSWETPTMPSETLTALNVLVGEFGVRMHAYMEGTSSAIQERRRHADAETVTEVVSTNIVWFVTHAPDQWAELARQLRYFNVQATTGSLADCLQATQQATIVLLDAQGMTLKQFVTGIRALRGRYSASCIVGLNVATDFAPQNQALRAGCDYCFVQGTAHPQVMDRIVKLCSNEEEGAYRVLVVEDSKTASIMIRRALSEGGIESIAIEDPLQVLTSLSVFRPDLVLMDMYLPGCTGVEVTRVIRQHAEFLSTPVVYLSTETDVALQVDALRLGGDHFLTKPFNPVILNAVVNSKIERYRALRRSMVLDSLTGLLNHTASKQKLDAMMANALREESPLCVAMVDIDHFKHVNDTYGHPVGDHVIRSIAWLLKQRLRKTDAVGRYGGEEFLVILGASNGEQAWQLLNAIRVDFGQIRHTVPEKTFTCTFSCGVAEWTQGMGPEDLIEIADGLLYKAKHSGRNQVVVQSAPQSNTGDSTPSTL